jgi:hypothetical protein
MISSYRLGDLVILDNLNENEKTQLLTDYPDSFGSKYVKRKKDNDNNIDIITEIVLEDINEKLHFLPQDIEDSTVIHLRLGDVIAGNEWHEKLKRPVHKNHLKTLLKNDNNKKYIIGKCFFAKTSSTNVDECVELSNRYLQNVINELEGEHFDSGNADIDLCCAVKSKLFLQGRGYFSKLILEIRKKLNLNNIETSTEG